MDTTRFDTLTEELARLKKNKFINFFKIGKIQTELTQLSEKIAQKCRADMLENCQRSLKHRGLLFQGTILELEAALTNCLPQMRAIGCKRAFSFISDPDFALVLFSDDGSLSQHAVEPDFALEEAKKHGPIASLALLQEVSGWLHNHGVAHAPLLDLTNIEKRLSALMQSCPHGAYMLHAYNSQLTLSRLSPIGKIEHLLIDIEKELGCYTMLLDGKEIAATRIQFKKRLEQMGTPLRLK